MSGYARYALPLVLTFNFAHAAKDAQASASSAVTRPVCETNILTTPIDGLRSLVPIESHDPLQTITANYAIEIMRGDYKGMLGSERIEKQDELARKGGELLAKELLRIEGIADEQTSINSTLFIQQFGTIPQNALDKFSTILKSGLSSLERPDEQPQFMKDTKNSLEELTRVVTTYRKEALTVDWVSNLLFKFKLKDQSRYVRSHFHSVQSAIAKIDDTFETALAKMYQRHYDMLDARIQLKNFERYAQLCTNMGLEAKRLIEEYVDENDFSQEQKDRINKNVLVPLTQRVAAIVRSRTSVGLSFNTFAVLMDSNLNLISVIGNIRETANLDLTTFGAANIIINEQREILNLANSTQDALAEVRNEMIAKLKQNGIMMREIPKRDIQTMHEMVDQIGQLEAELVVAADWNKVAIGKYTEAIGVITPKLDAIASRFERSLETRGPIKDPGSIISTVDNTLKDQIGRKSTDLDKMPAPVEPLALPAPQ